MRADRQNPHIAALRRFKPTKFDIKLRDGTVREVALSSKANRWELLLGIIDKLPWSTIEALDNDGKLLGMVQSEEDDEPEEFVDDEIIRAGAIAKIIKDAVFQTLTESRKIHEVQVKGYAEMMRSMLDSQQVIVDSYRTAMQVQQMATNVPPEEQDKVMEMMKIAFMMMSSGKAPQINVSASPAAAAKPANPKPAINGVAKPG